MLFSFLHWHVVTTLVGAEKRIYSLWKNVQCFEAMLYWCTVHLNEFFFIVYYFIVQICYITS